MTTVVTFEAGTIGDSMKKAARVAPSKVGSAFDKAAGIVLDIAPGSNTPCIVRATDTSIFYFEILDVLKAEGNPVRWRLPSQLISNVLGTLPATAGKQVTFTQISSSQVEIKSGRMTAKVILNANPYYPEWEPSDSAGLTVAPNFGGNITRVEWAASKPGPPPLNGVHLDGTHIIATDRYRIARVPCLIDLPHPVTIPAWSVGSLLKQMGDVLVGFGGNLFVAMPDDYTQVKTIVLGDQYLDLKKVIAREFDEQVEFRRAELTERITRAVNFAGADRAPILEMFIGQSEVAIMLQNQEVGLFGDVVEVPGQASHRRVKLRFTPQMLLDALSNAPNDKVILKYNPNNTNLPVSIDGDSGYQVWIAPRQERAPE